MLSAKLARLKELIETKEKVDAEIEALISGTAPEAKRGRPRKSNGDGSGAHAEPEQKVDGQQAV